MRTVTMTAQEFYSFKQLATFAFDMQVKQGFIYVTADADHLDSIGY